MTRLLVTGGRQRGPVRLGPLREWQLFDQARLLELDTSTGEVRVRIEYESPPEHVPPEGGSLVFKAGSVAGDELLLVTQTEVLVCERDPPRVRAVRSHPWFNDLHHVARFDGELHVVSTGLDRLFVVDDEGTVRGEHAALERGDVRALEPGVDYRRLPTTKPHAAHPNYVFRAAGGTWLTRFEQRDAVRVDDPAQRFAIDVGRPHDGIVRGDGVWFTTVNGHLVELGVDDRALRRDIDLNAALEAAVDGEPARPLGWCRGLAFADDVAFVGFSRIRYTRFRQNLSWIRRGFRSARGYTDLPTRVLAFDVEARRSVGEWDLEPFGLNAIFSVLGA